MGKRFTNHYGTLELALQVNSEGASTEGGAVPAHVGSVHVIIVDIDPVRYKEGREGL